MHITHREVDDVVILDLSGVFFEWAHQKEGREQFIAHFTDLLDKGRTKFVINLAKVDGIDSLGWAILLHAYKRIREQKGEFVLINAGDRYKPLLQVLRFDKIWKHFDSETEAIEYLSTDH